MILPYVETNLLSLIQALSAICACIVLTQKRYIYFHFVDVPRLKSIRSHELVSMGHLTVSFSTVRIHFSVCSSQQSSRHWLLWLVMRIEISIYERSRLDAFDRVWTRVPKHDVPYGLTDEVVVPIASRQTCIISTSNVYQLDGIGIGASISSTESEPTLLRKPRTYHPSFLLQPVLSHLLHMSHIRFHGLLPVFYAFTAKLPTPHFPDMSQELLMIYCYPSWARAFRYRICISPFLEMRADN